MSRSTRRRLIAGLALAGAISLVLVGAYLLAFFSTLQSQSQDLLLFKTPQGLHSRVTTVVGIDERTLDELLPRYGTLLSWPRTLYAQALDALRQASPRVIAIDRVFDTVSPDDAELAAAIQRARNVVLAVDADFPVEARPSAGVAQRFKIFVHSVSPIRDAAAAEGVVKVQVDADGVIRRLPLLVQAGDEQLPALPLATVARFLNRRAAIDRPATVEYVFGAGRSIPLTDEAAMLIRFLGPPARREAGDSFPVISFIDLLNGTFDRELVNDRIVLLGTMLPNLDEKATPTTRSSPMWGVEVLANAVETIFGNRYLVAAPPALTIALIALFAAIAALLAALRRPLYAALGTAGLLGLYLLSAMVAVDNGLLLNVIYPSSALLLSFAAALVYRVVFEQAEQRVIRGVMARYLSPSVSQWVLRDPDRLNLGGETRQMTVLFSDVRGFTTISHALDPQALVALLNEYMTAMTEVVFRYDGVLDKYIGDAIMAFWNAPMDQPDHARRACDTALDMIERLGELQRDWQRRQVPPLELGIGINTGPMVVGNMGSRQRLAYTVLGDTVNVSSRLEGLSKEYLTRVVIGEATRAAAGDAFVYRFLDYVAVKGRAEPLLVYEVVARAGELPTEQGAVLAEYQRGIDLYRSGQFGPAAELFEQLHRRAPEDGPTELYFRRAQELLADPPGPDWDGVYVAHTK